MTYKRYIIELADSTTSDPGVVGGTYSTSALLPSLWLRKIVDAAKKEWYATQYAYQTEVPKGNKDVMVPLRTVYVGSGTTWAGGAGEGASVNFTRLDNLCGVSLTPTDKNAGIAISNRVIRTHALDMIAKSREDLMYFAGDMVDKDMFATLRDATAATATSRGAQRILGGDAASASELAAGDTINTDIVAEGKRKLQSTICKYWSGGSESNSSEEKNPWKISDSEPFVLFIAPEQSETFETDSQFMNASEYGSDAIVKKGFGEIGTYNGVKIVISNNVPSYDASTTHADGTTTAVAQHRCIMIKAKKAAAIAWGQKPRLVIFDYPRELEKDLILEQAWDSKVLHSDAIVHIDVADE